METFKLPLVTALKGRHFLSTGDLSGSEFDALLSLALAGKKAGRQAFGTPLAGRGVGLVFFNPSLRTRTSMIMATAQLGGQAVPLEIGAGTWNLEHQDGVTMDGAATEHVREAVPVLGRYVDAIGVRCFPALRDLAFDRTDPVLHAFARHSTVPVINLESSMHHPCQALADMMTIKEKLGDLKRRKVTLIWANHPKVLPHAVPNSFALAALQSGVDLTIAAPPAYLPDDQSVAALQQIAAVNGGQLRLTTERQSAYEGAEVIYAKSWASTRYYGQIEDDLNYRRGFVDWQVTAEWMRRTNNGMFMHCLPVRRNVVVEDAVLDSDRSVVIDQAENRLHAQKALLASILA